MSLSSAVFENGSVSRAATSHPEPLTLTRLASLDAEALGEIYAKGTVPEFHDLDGTPRGRMLAFAGPLGRGRPFHALQTFAGSRYFPWDGKSFSSKGKLGKGINRVRRVGDLFKFETRIGPSALDGKPCLILDYDLSSNPWVIRQIHDELRQVSSRLYLGPAMWKTRTQPKLVLFFAIAP
jgi:hypothetical protein